MANKATKIGLATEELLVTTEGDIGEPPVNEVSLWQKPFATPMLERCYDWCVDVILDGFNGGVIYAPTRMGKTRGIWVLTDEMKLFKGRRGHTERSSTLYAETWNRKVKAEGGFFHWLQHEFRHQNAAKRQEPIERRHDVYEFLKGEANKTLSGRIILFVDEAQQLELTELGWFADIFNDLDKHGFTFVLFLVGTYHLHEWIPDLEGDRLEYVRERFFAREHRLSGVSSLEDFERCMKRYDTDKSLLQGRKSITEYYQPGWFADGGRLEKHAMALRAAFAKVRGKHKRLQVPMAHFARALKRILDTTAIDEELDDLDGVVAGCGYR